MDWTPQQLQAIEKSKSNILVAAAAGSGKTAVLVERIVNKIIKEKVDIDKLLIVTFTNAAASEMRERILKEIYKKLDESEDEKEVENLQRQVVLLNKANICTIDSFCLDVIRNNFFEVEISPNFRIADESESELLKQEVLEELFEEKYEEKDENFGNLIKTYTNYRDDGSLKDLILNIYDYISSSPYPLEWLKNAVEKFNLEENTDFAKTEWGEILIQEIKDELTDDIAILENEAKKLSLNRDLIFFQKTLEKDIYELKKLLENLDNWDKAYTIANSVEFIVWPRNKSDDEEKEIAKNIRDTVKKKYKEKAEKIFVSSSEEAVQDIREMYEILKKLEDLIKEFDERFFKKKKEKNMLDFSDVEHLALQILVKEREDGKHERTEVAKKYMQKFEEVAIDEYQDSNLVQEYILTSVSRGNNIFMVGDVKQSIYRFRQARPDLFLEKYDNYSLSTPNEKGLKIQLFENFRSRINILEYTNIVFQNIMSKTLGEMDYTNEEFLNLGAKWDVGYEPKKIKNEIDIIDTKETEEEIGIQEMLDKFEKINEEDTKNKKEEKKETVEEENEDEEEIENIEDIELEAKFVANKIKELIDSEFKVYDLKKQEYRNITYRDIAILMRSTKGKAPIFEKELMEKNVPVYSDMSSEYIYSMEIQTILAVLKIIDNPIQDIPLVTVMRSCIGKFTDNELVEIRLADRNSDFYTAMQKAKLSVSDNLREKVQNFIEKIETWRQEQEYLSLDELIWKIYEDTNFLNYMGILPNGSLRQANLKMLFERAKQYESASFKGLFNFIKFIEKLHSGNSDLSSAKMIGENEDVVRIMSIHKSKGLEFQIVFLVNSSGKFNLMDLNKEILLDQKLGIGVKYINYDMQIKYDTLTKLALKNKGLVSSLSEEMRILYVALTRAKEKLYIIGKSKDFIKQKEKVEEMLQVYKKQKDGLNPILVKKCRSYLEWILFVYYNNFDEMQNLTDLNIYKKQDLIKALKPEEKEEIDFLKELEERCKCVTAEDIEALRNDLSFKYEYFESTKIPSKTSISAIAHKDIKKNEIYEDEYLKPIKTDEDNELEDVSNENEISFPKPNFLNKDNEEKVSAGKRGTVVHLCMKNLDFSKEYELQDIKDLIKELEEKEIITTKEAESVNPMQILKFTKSDIWRELKVTKEYHKEEPFYINVSANEIEDVECEENIIAQGIIDLYYITSDDKLVLLDYKTDFIKEGEEQILIDRHKAQLKLYKQALENGLNRKVDKVYLYSTVLGKAISIICD